MPIQPTTNFIEVNGVLFPEVDTSIEPHLNNDIAFGADLLLNMWIYKNAVWATPSMQELIDNIPNYVDNNEKVFTLVSTNDLVPTLKSFKLIKRKVAIVQTNSIFLYQGIEVDKPINSDTITATNIQYNLFPNTQYTITIQ